jgi:hypothetical protein
MSAEQEPEPRQPRFSREAAARRAAEARQKAEIIFSRAYGLVRDPRGEWEQIKAEKTNIPSILLGYVAPLAAIPPLAGAIGGLAFGEQVGETVVRIDPGTVLVTAIVTFLASVALVYFMGILINTLAENFDAERDELAAQKVAAYSMTPAFVSGVFSLWPPLWWIGLIGIAMTAFLFYRGLPPLMRAPNERAMGYATTVMLAGTVAFIILFAVSGCVVGIGRLT